MDLKCLLNWRLPASIVRWVILLYLLFSVTDLLLLEHKWFILAGLTLGSVLSLLRFSVTNALITGFTSCDGLKKSSNRSKWGYILMQMVTLLLLAAALWEDIATGLGMALGTLFVPLAIMINSVTEALGITKNHFL